ncbi:hypothetical protein QV66_26805, partial [Klebsiella pneumoniae]
MGKPPAPFFFFFFFPPLAAPRTASGPWTPPLGGRSHMAPGDITTLAYFSLLSQGVPFTDDANKPILKQSLQPYFWPHITLNANL